MFHGKIYTIKNTISIFIRVTQTSKAMQTTAIRTVAKSLPQNEVILLTFLISTRYIPYTDLRKFCGKTAGFRQISKRYFCSFCVTCPSKSLSIQFCRRLKVQLPFAVYFLWKILEGLICGASRFRVS